MSAPEPTVAVPVEEVKPADATPAVVEASAETKVEEPAAVVSFAPCLKINPCQRKFTG